MDSMVTGKFLRSVVLLEFALVGEYFLFQLFSGHKGGLLIILGVLVLISVVVIGWQKIRHKKAPVWWCFYKSLKQIVTAFVAFFAVVVAFFFADYFIGVYSRMAGTEEKNYYTTAEAEAILVEEKGQSILENAQLLLDLEPERYRALEQQEKVNILNRVAQIEAEYLGVKQPELRVKEMELSLVGRFVQQENVIYLNEIYLAYEETMLTGLLHEMYHAYQYACLDIETGESELLFFRQVESWRNEYENLGMDISTKSGYLSYYLQDIEASARKYASDRLNEYGKIIVLGNTL